MSKSVLTLSVEKGSFAIVKLKPDAAIPKWATKGNFWSVTRTRDELSIVCTKARGGWSCLRVHGPLDFALTGILASLAIPLARAGVSIFALSTFDTDYILVRETQRAKTVRVLRRAGHEVREDSGSRGKHKKGGTRKTPTPRWGNKKLRRPPKSS